MFITSLKSVGNSNQSQYIGTVISIFNLNGRGITKQRFAACVDYYFLECCFESSCRPFLDINSHTSAVGTKGKFDAQDQRKCDI